MTVETIHWHTVHPRYLGPASKILDLGANWGHFSYGIIERFGAKCVAVEPSPLPFAGIKQSDKLQKLQAAVGSRSEIMPFNVAADSVASSLLHKVSSHVETVDVQVYSLQDLVAVLGWDSIDLLKVDIEGAEIGMLDAVPDRLLTKIGQMTLEFHDFCDITPPSDVARILSRLRGLGFQSVRMSGVGHQDTWIINQRKLGISKAEIHYVRSVVRNWRGLKRVVGRKLAPQAASTTRGQANN